MNIVIVGCGTLGSSLSYSIALKSLDKSIKSISLVDNDILEYKNLPYVFINNDVEYKRFMGSPKVLCLNYIIKKVVPEMTVYRYYDKYENMTFDKEHILIDCRDNGNEDKLFKIKANIDGRFGKVIINPISNCIKLKRVPYSIKNSHYYSSLFSFNLCEKILFNKDLMNNNDRKEILIDLHEGTSYELSSNNIKELQY